MGRIKLHIPPELPFRTVLPVRITDLNYGAHLGNDSVLSMMHEARARFLAHHGMSETDAAGVSFIMGDCAIVYKAEAFFGDELEVFVGAGEYSRVSFDIYYRFMLKGSEKVIAEAKTGIVCFSYEVRKVQAVPEALKNALGEVNSPEKAGEGVK